MYNSAELDPTQLQKVKLLADEQRKRREHLRKELESIRAYTEELIAESLALLERIGKREEVDRIA